MDNSRSYMNTKQEKVKSNSPPEDFFSGKDLEMGRAIYNGDIKTIEHLIKEKGFDVNGRGETKSDGRLQRWSYIGYSILVSEIKSTEELLKLGADVNSYSFDGSGVITTIGQACSFKNKKIIELLLDYKVNLNPPLSGSPIQELLIGDNDNEGSITIQDPSGNVWYMDGNKNITVTAPDNININAGKDINMSAGQNLNIGVGQDMNTNVGNNNMLNIKMKHQFSSESYIQDVKSNKTMRVGGDLNETTATTTHRAKQGDLLIQSAGISKILGAIDAKVNKG